MSTRATNFVRLWLWCLGLFAATLWLHTRHNDFAYYYHTDEPGKVEQVLGREELNFHHPMLMLQAAKLARGGAQTEQEVVEAGRLVSAIFTAAAVVALSLAGYLWRGWLVAIAAGLALMLHHQLFELSHYLKEDTALLFGVALTFLALHLFEKRPRLTTAALVGIGCALAISGKYIGAVMLVPVVPVMLSRRTPARGQNLLVAFLALAAVLAWINWPLLANWDAAWASFERERQLATGGQGMTQSVPHAMYWSIFLSNSSPTVWILLFAMLVGGWRRRQEMTAATWATLAFPFLFAVLLSFFPKENDRYFLPATALFILLAAAGVQEVSRLLPSRWSSRERLCEIAAAVLLLADQFVSWTDDRGGLVRYWTAFQKDDTAELTEWLRTHLPPGAIVAKDEKVRLPDAERHTPESTPLPFKVLSDNYAGDLSSDGTVEGLLARGVTHVVITDSTFRKFDRQGFRPKPNEEEEQARRRNFYAALRRDFTPARAWPRGTVVYLHPGLEVYVIRP